MPSVQDFLAQINKRGLARTEKFRVEITPPPLLAAYNGAEQLRGMNIFCESAVFPSVTINTKKARIHNLDISRPSTVDYGGEVAMFVFIVDGTWEVKKFFNVWANLIVDRNREVAQYTDIIGSIDLFAVHESNTSAMLSEHKEETPYSIKFVDVFPRTIEPLFTANTSIGVHRLGVQFTYKYWIEI